MVADGKRGDVPVSASAYAQALFGSTPSPFGEVAGLGADAATLNGTLGRDSLAPLIEGAAQAGVGLFVLVRTSNPGASDLLDQPAPDAPFHERLAEMVADLGVDLVGETGLSGLGAVVGATEPSHIARLRELCPYRPFSFPGLALRAAAQRTSGLPSALIPLPRSSPPLGRSRALTIPPRPPKGSARRFGKWLAGLSTPASRTMNQGYDRDEPGGLESDGNHDPILIHARKTLPRRADRRLARADRLWDRDLSPS